MMWRLYLFHLRSFHIRSFPVVLSWKMGKFIGRTLEEISLMLEPEANIMHALGIKERYWPPLLSGWPFR